MGKKIKLINASENTFTDISSEVYREYQFMNSEVVRIESPLWLSVSKNGHRILDAEGVSHYIPATFMHLAWKAKKNSPHFVK